ncbi:hypothetical protein CCAX7_40010 [Capsulimonas corticalis]|uniref:Uncharacterized protein n=1 Tax=Capsulimonas corticalis TaxID=2219043 RepID=A0A402D4U1_9BACT|nr:DUF642 domain-containing protein [Capsulimonas corticalis]BDI31950.1 hypothetical protein CCAX7_40010 [Capsulimonas corticalis]
MTKKMMAAIAVLGLTASLAGSANATNLVKNGGFEATSNGPGQMNHGITSADYWTTDGYNFIFTKDDADSPGVDGQYGHLDLKLWGPANGSANGLTASPTGGNYVGADGAYNVGAITQNITGLKAGHTYAVGFDWAAAQQYGYTGDTTDKWTVSLGGDSHTTSITALPSHDFSGWKHQTFNFTATSGSEVLSFLATGTPNGVPPFALLDGVTLTAVPEPSSLAAMFAGVFGLGVIIRRRSVAKKSAA